MSRLVPQLSVITINLNNLEGLKKTIHSVFEQTFKDYEYIIIDGDSNDGSKQYVEAHAERLDYWISEKDAGIYQAMNKGIRQSKGEYILFLNSGDFLHDETTLQNVVARLSGEDLIYGNVIHGAEFGRKTHFPEKLDFEFMLFATLPHPATFIKRRLFETVGVYDENYRIVSDWLFYLLALFRHNSTYRYMNMFVSVFDETGISSSIKWQDVHKNEKDDVVSKYFYSEMALYNQMKNYRDGYSRIVNRFPINKMLRLKILLSKIVDLQR